jgi:hypothetical protein
MHHVPAESEIIADELSKNDKRNVESEGHTETETTMQSELIQENHSVQSDTLLQESTFS